MAIERESSQSIQLIYEEIETREGEKFFGSAARVVTKIGSLDTSALASSLDSFLERIAPAFNRASRALGAYELKEIEVSLAVTASGEIRLIGGVSSEISGGIRLKFTRQEA